MKGNYQIFLFVLKQFYVQRSFRVSHLNYVRMYVRTYVVSERSCCVCTEWFMWVRKGPPCVRNYPPPLQPPSCVRSDLFVCTKSTFYSAMKFLSIFILLLYP